MKVLATLLALLPATLMAQEVPEPRVLFIRGGVLCNTEIELQQLLTAVALNNGEFPKEVPEGCGRFVPREPIPMVVTPKYWYETPHAKTLVAHFLYVPQMWEQWGWVAFELNPNYKQPKGDPA